MNGKLTNRRFNRLRRACAPVLLGLLFFALYGLRGGSIPAGAILPGIRADARTGARASIFAGDLAGDLPGKSTGDLARGQESMVALTFDDGPHPACTERLLDGLKERGVRATFFVIGENADREPQLVARAAAEGHLVGNHTYSHVKLTDCSEEESLREVSRTNELLYQITGSVTEYIRPPFGLWSRLLEESFPLRVVLWDVDPMDWKHRDADYIVREVLCAVEDGSIILLHDIYETSVDAALRIVDKLQAEGYVFVTVDELFPD